MSSGSIRRRSGGRGRVPAQRRRKGERCRGPFAGRGVDALRRVAKEYGFEEYGFADYADMDEDELCALFEKAQRRIDLSNVGWDAIERSRGKPRSAKGRASSGRRGGTGARRRRSGSSRGRPRTKGRTGDYPQCRGPFAHRSVDVLEGLAKEYGFSDYLGLNEGELCDLFNEAQQRKRDRVDLSNVDWDALERRHNKASEARSESRKRSASKPRRGGSRASRSASRGRR